MTQLVDEKMVRDSKTVSGKGEKSKTGNSNKKLNKVVLGNIKHKLFEEVLDDEKEINSKFTKKLVYNQLKKEKIKENHSSFKEYLTNLYVFFGNCIIFKKKYLDKRTPLDFLSKNFFNFKNRQ